MSTKKCFKCHKIKPLRLYYRHKRMADSHLNKCKKCTKKDVQDRYNDPIARQRIREYERKRFKDPRRKQKMMEYARKRDFRHPGKLKARSRLGDAIKTGRIIRKPCEVCGDIKSQGHHTDYRKYRDVKWLCFKHHRITHKQIVG